MAIEPSAPTSMKGFRTLSASERSPNTTRAIASAAQNQVFNPLACATEKLVPFGFSKTVDQ